MSQNWREPGFLALRHNSICESSRWNQALVKIIKLENLTFFQPMETFYQEKLFWLNTFYDHEFYRKMLIKGKKYVIL